MSGAVPPAPNVIPFPVPGVPQLLHPDIETVTLPSLSLGAPVEINRFIKPDLAASIDRAIAMIPADKDHAVFLDADAEPGHAQASVMFVRKGEHVSVAGGAGWDSNTSWHVGLALEAAW